jgi:hypothetical protein
VTLNFVNLTAVYSVTCSNSPYTATSFILPITDQNYTVAAGSTAWYPAGGAQADNSTYQSGPQSAPSLAVCGGGAMSIAAGANLVGNLYVSVPVSVNMRMHYGIYKLTGTSWSGTLTVAASQALLCSPASGATALPSTSLSASPVPSMSAAISASVSSSASQTPPPKICA